MTNPNPPTTQGMLPLIIPPGRPMPPALPIMLFMSLMPVAMPPAQTRIGTNTTTSSDTPSAIRTVRVVSVMRASESICKVKQQKEPFAGLSFGSRWTLQVPDESGFPRLLGGDTYAAGPGSSFKHRSSPIPTGKLLFQLCDLGQIVVHDVRLRRVQRQIILVIVLGRVELFERAHLCHDRLREYLRLV